MRAATSDLKRVGKGKEVQGSHSRPSSCRQHHPLGHTPALDAYRDAERTLADALEAVRQDMLTLDVLDGLCARLDALPALSAGDPLLSMGCATTEMH